MARLAGLAVAVAVLLSSCGTAPPQIVEVEGIVLLDGAPLPSVEVRFVPKNSAGAGYMAKGVTDKNGRFALACKGQPGACAGENHVVIVEAEIPARLRSEKAQLELAVYLDSLDGRPLPEKYTSLANNPLVVRVSDEQAQYKIELQR